MADKESENMGHQVFISYATERIDSKKSDSDRQVVDLIYSRLKAENILCWVAHQDIEGGKNWPDEISKAITKSRVIIVVLSSNSNKSRYVDMEVTQSADEDKIIIPFFIDDVSLRAGLKFMLGNRQRINAYPCRPEHLDELLKTICGHLWEKPEKPSKSIKAKELDKEVKKEIKELEEMPEDVRDVASRGIKVEKNKKDLWEAHYQDEIVMVYIPPGQFTMGSDDHDNEKPPHNVFLDGYWMGKYEVTFDQYDKYCGETNQEEPQDRGWGRGKRPVINVSWHDAAAYCDWLSKKIGLKFKLPTEAQWEKAARGEDGRRYPWGKREPDGKLANFGQSIGKTSPVGTYPHGASPYGLLDMSGNVWGWCADWYGSDYYKNSPGKNPMGPKSGTYRVLRGGGWGDDAQGIRCAYRDIYDPSYRAGSVGFRLCQDNN